jgi:hypothetical protein
MRATHRALAELACKISSLNPKAVPYNFTPNQGDFFRPRIRTKYEALVQQKAHKQHATFKARPDIQVPWLLRSCGRSCVAKHKSHARSQDLTGLPGPLKPLEDFPVSWNSTKQTPCVTPSNRRRLPHVSGSKKRNKQ